MLAIDSTLTFMIASALLCLSPGPDNIFVLTQSALSGRKSGILVTLGLCTGLIVHTTVVALGVAALLKESSLAFTILKSLGALYLLYLAWQAWRAAPMTMTNATETRKFSAQLYRRGVLMNLTNPKVSIFFLAFLPQFAAPEYGSLGTQLFALGGVFILVALIVFSTIAISAGTLGAWLKSFPQAQAYLNRVAAVVFVGLAINLVFAELSL